MAYLRQTVGWEFPDPRPMTDRDRQLVALQLASPKRARAPQHDTSDCPLFVAANEPRLF